MIEKINRLIKTGVKANMDLVFQLAIGQDSEKEVIDSIREYYPYVNSHEKQRNLASLYWQIMRDEECNLPEYSEFKAIEINERIRGKENVTFPKEMEQIQRFINRYEYFDYSISICIECKTSLHLKYYYRVHFEGKFKSSPYFRCSKIFNAPYQLTKQIEKEFPKYIITN